MNNNDPAAADMMVVAFSETLPLDSKVDQHPSNY
jgi:hypothetical protein